MKTKKDLEVEFNLSDNTVYKTLQACSLDTSKTEYTDEEIENYFRPAREMLDQGSSYKQVKEHFVPQDRAHDPQNNNSKAASNLTETIGEEVKETVQEVMNSAVSEIVPLMPQMMVKALMEQALGGRISQSFADFRQQMQQNMPKFINVDEILEPNSKGLAGDVDPDWQDADD